MRELELHIRSGDINDEHILEAFEQDLIKTTSDFAEIFPSAIHWIEQEIKALNHLTTIDGVTDAIRANHRSELKKLQTNAAFLHVQIAMLKLAEVKQNLLQTSSVQDWQSFASD